MSTNTSNHLVNPAAREAMDKFKMEAAAEVGVNLKNGYNGELTSRQAGSVGGQMVKKNCPTENADIDVSTGHMVRKNCPMENADIDVSTSHMIQNNCPMRTLTFQRPSRISDNHIIDITYIFKISI